MESKAKEAKEKAEKPPKRRRFWRFVGKTLLYMFVSSFLYVLAGKWIMPPITLTQLSNGISYGLKRNYMPAHLISTNARLAAIASEDQRFPDHNGFDLIAIEKSFKPRKKKKNKLPRGAGTSTISQQTAKNVFLWQGGGIWKYVRKVPEAYFTLLIEQLWGKQRILEVYLNVIEMGPGIFGIEAASQAYFNKSSKELTRQEAAMIIACLPNPKKFSVKPPSVRVAWRYPQILREMHNIEDDEDVQTVITPIP